MALVFCLRVSGSYSMCSTLLRPNPHIYLFPLQFCKQTKNYIWYFMISLSKIRGRAYGISIYPYIAFPYIHSKDFKQFYSFMWQVVYTQSVISVEMLNTLIIGNQRVRFLLWLPNINRKMCLDKNGRPVYQHEGNGRYLAFNRKYGWGVLETFGQGHPYLHNPVITFAFINTAQS